MVLIPGYVLDDAQDMGWVVGEHKNKADSLRLELELDLSFAKNIRELRFQKRQLVKAKFFFKSSIHDFQNFEK